MSNIINLNQARKKRARLGKEQQADQNKAKFGRSKGQKKSTEKEHRLAEVKLEGHHLEEREDE